MKVLIIGGGAIGQLFAHHLGRGGAAVHVLVRPHQAAALSAGGVVYPLNRPRRTRTNPVPLHVTVHTDQDAALALGFDLVVLAVSSVALRTGDWLARLGAQRGDAHILGLQAGADDSALVAEHVPDAQLAWGMLSVISLHAPLPGEARTPPGVAFWFPPLAPLGFSGPNGVVTPILAVLTAGGMPVRRVPDLRTRLLFTGPLLDKTVQALEAVGWSFRALRSDPEVLRLAVRAMNEAWTLAEATTGATRPVALWGVHPLLLRGALALAPRLVPFNLERFFTVHFTKVGAQTVALADAQLARAAEAGIAMPASAALLSRVRARR